MSKNTRYLLAGIGTIGCTSFEEAQKRLEIKLKEYPHLEHKIVEIALIAEYLPGPPVTPPLIKKVF